MKLRSALRNLFGRRPARRTQKMRLARGEAIEADGVMIGIADVDRRSNVVELLIGSVEEPTWLKKHPDPQSR